MPDDDLTPVQRSVLLILMAEAREVPNAELTNRWKLKLEKRRRDELEKADLITVRREGRFFFLEIADRGWSWCRTQGEGEVPDRAGHGGAAAYAILAGIQRFLNRSGPSLPEFFARPDELGAAPSAQVLGSSDIEALVRKAYQELADGPGRWVKLSDLRGVLSGSPRADVDRVLVEMNRKPDVSIVPESNQKALTDEDRAAAVWIGNQEKHLVAIGMS
jgi:hypothetical protein